VEADKHDAKFSKNPIWQRKDDAKTTAPQGKLDAFQNAIHHHGTHPMDAAAEAGDLDYKSLGIHGPDGELHQIRLNQHERATFWVNPENHTVKLHQIGGHT